MSRAAVLLLAPLLAPGQILFEEIAVPAGIDFKLHNAAAGEFRQIELMPAGVAALDYNTDGCIDLYFINGAAIPSLKKESPRYWNRLYRNNCDLTFTDVTRQSGAAGEGYSMAVAAADYDNDGDPDLFVAGVKGNLLFRNNGDGAFTDVTREAGLTGADPLFGRPWSISAGWFDYDNDGWLDLFVSNYIRWDLETEPRCGPEEYRFYCHPDEFEGLPHQLFRNNGDGTFTDVTRPSGLIGHIGKGMGVAFADFDRNGSMDVFVANDSVRHFLFQNNGDGTFSEVALEAGVALREDGTPIAGMGADFRDFDNDGLPDIVVSGMLNDTFQLYRNTGDPLLWFEDYTIQSGLADGTRQITGWSLGMYDLDNDGWKDFFFAASHFPQLERFVGRSELPNRVFRNPGRGRFQDVSAQAGEGFQQPALHHGTAFADFDNDGRVDVAVSALNGRARLFRNVTPGGAWLAFRLTGTQSNRDGLGTEVRVSLPDGRGLYNHASTSVGYASSSEPLVRFGIGQATVASAEVRWPSGAVQSLTKLEPNRVIELREPAMQSARREQGR